MKENGAQRLKGTHLPAFPEEDKEGGALQDGKWLRVFQNCLKTPVF